MTTLEPRPFHSRTVENCDQLIDKHLFGKSTLAGKLAQFGLTRDAVVDMVSTMTAKGAILDKLKDGDYVTSGCLQLSLDKSAKQIGNLIRELRIEGHEIEVLYYGNPLITSYKLIKHKSQ